MINEDLKNIQIDLPAEIKFVLDRLNKFKHKAYVVGGCVRDSILGKNPDDWDVTTSASPDEIKYAFADQRTIDTGIKHGTVTVIISKKPVEVTAFRTDGAYSDSRHPDFVNFTKDIHEDLSRRDFTINAMAYNPKYGLIDEFGGISDLHNKIIRTVGDPEKRFSEDALRIMRAVRFSSVLGFEIEKNTADAIKKDVVLLLNISAERIQKELIKLLVGENVFDVLLNYREVFGAIIPELTSEFDFRQIGKKHAYDVWTHTCHTVKNIEPDSVLRLTMLLHDVGKPVTCVYDENGDTLFPNHAAVGGIMAENILKRLRFPNKVISKVSYLVSIHDKKVPETKVDVKKYICDVGADNFLPMMKIRKADRSALSDGYNDISDKINVAISLFYDIINNNEPYMLSQLKINGNDLNKKGVDDEKIGGKLNEILEKVIENPNLNEKHTLLEMI